MGKDTDMNFNLATMGNHNCGDMKAKTSVLGVQDLWGTYVYT